MSLYLRFLVLGGEVGVIRVGSCEDISGVLVLDIIDANYEVLGRQDA